MSALLGFGDKIRGVISEAVLQVGGLATLPANARAFAAFVENRRDALPGELVDALRQQLTAEQRFAAGGEHDAVLVREATKATLAFLTATAVDTLDSGGPAAAGAGRGAAGAVAAGSAPASGGAAAIALVGTLKEAGRLVSLRMETGADSFKSSDERSMRIASRIEKAEQDAVGKKELLVASRVARVAQKRELEAAISRLRAEMDAVRAQGRASTAVLDDFVRGQSAAVAGGHDGRVLELSAELARAQAEFARFSDANEAAQSNLRKRRNHMRTEVSRVVGEYDRDQLELAGRREKVEALLEAEGRQLAILRAHFGLVDVDMKMAAAEAEVVRRRLEAAATTHAARAVPSARRIQRWWRKKAGARPAAKGAAKKGAKGKGRGGGRGKSKSKSPKKGRAKSKGKSKK